VRTCGEVAVVSDVGVPRGAKGTTLGLAAALAGEEAADGDTRG